MNIVPFTLNVITIVIYKGKVQTIQNLFASMCVSKCSESSGKRRILKYFWGSQIYYRVKNK